MGAELCVFEGEGFEVDAGEVEEGVFVVGAEVAVGLVVGGVCAVEGCVNFGFDGVKGVKNCFRGVEVFAGAGIVF